MKSTEKLSSGIPKAGILLIGFLALVCVYIVVVIQNPVAEPVFSNKSSAEGCIPDYNSTPEPSGFSKILNQPTRPRTVILSSIGDHRIREETEEYVIEYAASRLLLNFKSAQPPRLQATEKILHRSGFAVERISPDTIMVCWNASSLESFDRNFQILSSLFPDAVIDKDFVNRKTAWTEGEAVHDINDRLGHQWLYEMDLNAKGIIVAVIDSGTTFDHEELSGMFYTSPSEVPDNVDNDGNGFVDDLSGWDFFENDNNPTDEDGHGTAICGVIAANGTNGIGVAGIAPGAIILPVRFLDTVGEGYDSDAIKAIDYSRQAGAHVINASWGRDGEASPSLRSAIRRYIESGGIFVTAAGNDGEDIDANTVSPGSLDLAGMVVVGGVRKYFDYLDESSNYGKTSVDILAPYSQFVLSRHSRPRTRSGTSISAAIVSGILAVTAKNFPSLTPSEVINRILETSAFVWGPRDRIAFSGTPSYPRIFGNKRPEIPRITSHNVNPDPVHVGEVSTVSFDITGDEYAVVTAEKENGEFMLSRNRLSSATSAEEETYFFRVYGLRGHTDHGFISIQATPSAPYITYSLPEKVDLETISSGFNWPVKDQVRGDRFVELEMGLNGFDRGLYVPWKIDFDDPVWAGQLQIVMRNRTGQTVIELSTSWRGKRNVEIWNPQGQWQDGKDFLNLGAAGILRFDGEGITEHPYPAGFTRILYGFSSKVYHDWIILSDLQNSYTSLDGVTWIKHKLLPFDRYIVAGKYSRWWILYEHPHNRDIWFYDVERGDLHLLTNKPDRSPGVDTIVANGGSILICDSWSSSPLVYNEGGKWIKPDDINFEGFFQAAGLVNGEYVVIYRDPVNGDTAWVSSDGTDWISSGCNLSEHKEIFLVNHIPCFFEGSVLYSYSTDLMDWKKVCDFDAEIIYDSTWSIPLEDETGKLFVGGKFIRYIQSAEWIRVSNDGIYAGTENAVYFSSTLDHWTAVSNGPGKVVLNGEAAYLVDAESFYLLEGAASMRAKFTGPGSDVDMIHLHGDHLFVKDESSWKVWDYGNERWSVNLSQGEFTFEGVEGRFRTGEYSKWTELPENYDDGMSESDGVVSFKGKSLYYDIGGRTTGRRLKSLEDVDPARESTYAFFPHARSSKDKGWFEDPDLGWFYEPEEEKYIVSIDHGWLYMQGDRNSSMYLHDGDLDWLLYEPQLYPLLYCYKSQRWLYYWKGSSSPRWFFDYNLMQWFKVR